MYCPRPHPLAVPLAFRVRAAWYTRATRENSFSGGGIVKVAGLFEVMIERNFSSAHQLRGYKGKCENLHGHNYKIEIYARGSELDNIGLLVDFGELKGAADEVVAYLDHRNINELPPFDEELNPSAENLARYILERVSSRVGDERVRVYKVRCFETPTSVATYQVD
jgi:6-pyruvoyltetrahydropterin/6-carboxytetrahydropterin synthase